MERYCFTYQIRTSILFWIPMIFLLYQQGMAQNRPYFSRVDAFWVMFESYRQDKYPSEEQWQSFKAMDYIDDLERRYLMEKSNFRKIK